MKKHVSRMGAMVRRWLRGSSTSERAIEEEIESVVQHEIDARIASGMSPAEAQRTARAAFGSVEPIKEQVRDARTGALIENLVRDARYAWRGIRRSPGLSLAVVGSLAIGLAVTVAAIAFIKAMLFGSYPGITNQEQLVEVEIYQGQVRRYPSEADYLALRAGLDGLQSFAAFTYADVTAVLPEARSLTAHLVSANYFDVFGAQMHLGRAFGAQEDRPEHAAVAVISHLVWRRDFNEDSAVVGRTIRVADASVSIVGVAPPGFGGTSPGLVNIWMPLAMHESVAPDSTSMPGRERLLSLVGRLKDDVGPEQIRTTAATIVTQRLAAEGVSGQPVRVEISGVSRMDPEDRWILVPIVMPIPVLVLTIACVNAANLLLARGSRRRRELAIRLAIGAARGRVVRQLLIESLMLAFLAAALAAALASAGLRIVSSQFASNQIPLIVPIDWTVLAWTAFVATLSAVVCGLMPALRATARAPFRALSGAGADADGMRPDPRGRKLVVAQIALSIGVLATTTQLVALIEAQGGSSGTRPDRLLMASFDLDQLRFTPEAAERFYRQLVERAAGLSGVENAGLARRTAVWTFGRGKGLGSLAVRQPEAQTGEVIQGGYAGGDLVGALGLSVVEGRAFVPADRTGPPRVAVVNQAYAKRMPEGHALGRTLRVQGWNPAAGPPSEERFRDVEIVGVIGSVGEPAYSLDGEAMPKIYLPAPLQPEPALTLYIRTRSDASTLAGPVGDLVRSIDPRVPVLEIGSLAMWNERSRPDLGLARAGAFMGLMALLLAATGLLAVVSYVVSLRTREFAIRMALGSHPRGVLVLVIREAMRMVVIGFVIGGGLALLASGLLQTQFRGGGLDAGVFVGSAVLLIAVMFLASVVPAIRASRVNPVTGLKES